MVMIGRLEIRSAEVTDSPVIAALNQGVQLLHALNEPSYFRVATETDQVSLYFEAVIKNPVSRVLIAETAGTALGYVWFQFQTISASPFTYCCERAYLHHIAVVAEAQRKGVGSMLLQAAEAEAHIRDIAEIAVDTWAFNEEAQRFFRALGYDPARVILRKTVQSPSACGRR